MNYIGKFISNFKDFYNEINSATLTGAIDVIVVKQPDETYSCSPFHVRFGKMGVLRSKEKIVDIEINGEPVDIHMKLGDTGEAFFVEEVENEDEQHSVPSYLATSPLLGHLKGDDFENPFNSEISNFGASSSTNSTSKKRRRKKSVKKSPPKQLNQQEQEQVLSSNLCDIHPFSDGEVEQSSLESSLKSKRPSSPLSDTEYENSRHDSTCQTGGIGNGGEHIEWGWGEFPRSNTPSSQSLSHLAETLNISDPLKPESNSQGASSANLMPSNATMSSNESSKLLNVLKFIKKEDTTKTRENSEMEGVFLDDLNSMDPEKAGLYLSPGERTQLKQEQQLKNQQTAQQNLQQTISEPVQTQSQPQPQPQLQQPQQPSQQPQQSEYRSSWWSSWTRSTSSTSTKAEQSTDQVEFDFENELSEPEMGESEQSSSSDSEEEENTLASSEDEEHPEGIPIKKSDFRRGHRRKNSTVQYKKVLRISSQQIASLNLQEGRNEVVFSVTTAYQGTTRCKCSIYLWNHDDKIIVSDIDGTITKSDILGHILPVIGKDWAQSGVANLFNKIQDNGYKLLYLSARAIGQAKITREYLKSIRQGDICLPDGPLLLSPTSLISAFRREVIEKKPEEFKIKCLKDIQCLFPTNPFYAGFGNKINDTWAYRAIDIPLSRIFTINHRGELRLVLIQSWHSSYNRLSDLVDQMFPPLPSSLDSKNSDFLSEYTAFNYWRDPIPDISQFEALKSELNSGSNSSSQLLPIT